MTPTFDGKSFFIKGGKTGVLLLHGFTATTFEVKALGDYLHSMGLTVSAPLLPGHGSIPEDLNQVKWEDWVSSAQQAFEDLHNHCEHVFVGGESMGGLLSLALAQQGLEIQGLMLYAPALINHKLLFTPLLRYFLKFSKKKDSDDIFEWQGYQVNPVAGAAELFFLQRRVSAHLDEISQPVIIFQGRNDRTVSPSGASLLHDRIASEDKELVWYDCGHCVLLENDFEDAARRTLEFIRRNNAPV